LIECCGKSFKDLRPAAGRLQPVLDEAALRIVKDNVDVAYVNEVLESVNQSKQNLHQPSPDVLCQDRDVYTKYKSSMFNEMQGSKLCRFPLTYMLVHYVLYLSQRDRSIRGMSNRKYCHGRANVTDPLTHPIPRPKVPQDDNRTWMYWIGEVANEIQGVARQIEVTEHLNQIQIAVETESRQRNRPTNLDWTDGEGETLLHTFISLIDPRTMEADHVQDTLLVILSCSGDSLYTRNCRGDTPLHLAIKLALPHVVATLLRHLVGSHATLSGLVNDEGSLDLLKKVIEVPDGSGLSLITNLHLTYWLARESDEPEALHFEIDALICIRIIVNAMIGHLPAATHKFRPFRKAKEFIKRRDIVSRRARHQHGRGF
jgi:hypothetical protein